MGLSKQDRLRRRVRRMERIVSFIGGVIMTCGLLAVIIAIRSVL